jgi:hypothetical protein
MSSIQLVVGRPLSLKNLKNALLTIGLLGLTSFVLIIPTGTGHSRSMSKSVSDDRATLPTSNATVNVIDDTPPALGVYPNVAVTAAGNITVTSDIPPAGSIMSITAAPDEVTQSPFTGVLSVNPITGVVTITNAKPAGTYTVRVTAVNSGLRSSSTFTLTVNNPFSCSPGSFRLLQSPGSPFTVGSNPYGVAVGDFNRDDKQDLAVTNFSFNNVTILLGNGNGGFNEAPNSPIVVGSNPEYAAVGDFNGDGKQDLAVANAGSSNVSILLGNGNGEFSEVFGSPFGGAAVSARSVAVGDFNADAKQDLAVGMAGGAKLTILIGNGSGAFSEASGSPIDAGSFAAYVAVGEFNGDGKQDLAVANGGSNSLTILLGNGNAEFSQAAGSPIRVGTQPLAVAVGDFNSDGKHDIVVANTASDTVTILLGNGEGNFIEALGSPVGAGTLPRSVVVGDFNGDGKQDLAAVNHIGSTATVLLGDGSGRFIPAIGSPFGTGITPYSTAVGDFNGDGKQDLAVANVNSDNVTVLLNTCAPNTAPAISSVGFTRQQGNASFNSSIATVSDSEDTKDQLTVSINGSGSVTTNGVTVSNLDINAAGSVTADVAAACGAFDASFTLSVIDSGGLSSSTILNVTVTPNSQPVLGSYPSVGPINVGANTTVTPASTPTDNGSITAISVSAPGFNGNLSVDLTTGAITITNAGPAGTHNVTVTATDNCNSTSTTTFSLQVNGTPSITGAGITRQQGSQDSNSQIATINDLNESAGTLAVTVTPATGAGVQVNGITINASGQVFANVQASCSASDSAFTLTVTDRHGATSTSVLTVAVTANAAPILGSYPSITLNPGASADVLPNVAPTDNGSVTLLMASASGFTGTFSGNVSTGAVTINNAAPAGNYVVGVVVTDNCGAVTNRTFTLTVNNPPTISGMTISIQRGSSPSLSQIGVVNDANQPANTLAVAVNGGTSATVNGVTISSLSVDTAGNLRANVIADCSATNASFTLSVTDNLGISVSSFVTVNVNPNTPPVVGNYPSGGTLNSGAATTVTPDAPPSDNGLITSLTVAVSGFNGNLSVNPNTGVVTISNAGPVGSYTALVTATDNCGTTITKSFTFKVIGRK